MSVRQHPKARVHSSGFKQPVPDSAGYDSVYATVMLNLWKNEENDQRKHVLNLLRPYERRYSTVVDIGPGDAYYISILKPINYIIVEPNDYLRQTAERRAASICHAFESFCDIEQLVDSQMLGASDVVLMCHVLFYLSAWEATTILSIVADKSVVIVHPSLQGSVTVEFEDRISWNRSRNNVRIKQALLGKPSHSQTVESHFRMPLSTSDETLAFLVCHTTLGRKLSPDRMELARQFVRERKNQWQRDAYYELPQGQLLELYNVFENKAV